MTEKPFFVVGFPRSGTTMLAAMLDRHSCIAMTPETLFFHDLYGDLEKRILKNETNENLIKYALANHRLRDMDVSVDAVLQRCMGKISAPSVIFDAVLGEYLSCRKRNLVGEKSPIHLLYINRISQIYPGAKFICILRDGRDSVASLMNVPWAHKNIARHSAEWVYRMKLVVQYQQRDDIKFHVVRFEELSCSPMQTMYKICQFLNVPYEQTMLEANTETSVIPEWEREWKGNALKAPDASRVNAWKRDATPHDIAIMNYVMKDALVEFGYDVSANISEDILSMCEKIVCSTIYSPTAYLYYRAAHNIMKKTFKHRNNEKR